MGGQGGGFVYYPRNLNVFNEIGNMTLVMAKNHQKTFLDPILGRFGPVLGPFGPILGSNWIPIFEGLIFSQK